MLYYEETFQPCIGKCEWDMVDFFFNLADYGIKSASLLTFFIFCVIYIASIRWQLFYVIVSIVNFYGISHGKNIVDHGFYNLIGLVSFIMIFFIPIIFIINLLKSLLRVKIYYIVIVFIVSFRLILVAYSTVKERFSCDGWDMGLNNTKIDNNSTIYPCEFNTLKGQICLYKGLNNIFDFTRIFRIKCTANINEYVKFMLRVPLKKRIEIIKYNKYLFPLTNKNQESIGEYGFHLFQRSVLNRLIPVPKNERGNYIYPNFVDENKTEVELTFDENNIGSLKVNLHRNEKLVEQRRKLAKISSSIYKNVLIIYTDTVSRAHYLRKLKKITKFIEKFMPYEPDINKKKFTAFQFMKYNTVGFNTFPNVKAMFYGVKKRSKYGINVVKFFKEQGFITGHAGSTCGKEIFEIYPRKKAFKFLDYNQYDHENVGMFCDDNYSNVKGIPGFQVPYLRCLYGKEAYKYNLEYMEQFWRAYKDEKKFFRIHINEAHEVTNELIKYFDEDVADLLEKFYKENLLNDTALFFISDHGQIFLNPFNVFYKNDFFVENATPSLFIMLPNDKKLYDNFYQNIHQNQQNLITSYDIYDTLIHIAFGYRRKKIKKFNSQFGISLLKNIDKNSRICTKAIPKRYCQCKKYN